MKFNLKAAAAVLACAALPSVTGAHAAVSAADAAALKNGKLTPLGGEKTGNADGSIPAWNGGLFDPNYNKSRGRRDDLFRGEKPLFSITAQNAAQYADKLTEGAKGMLSKYPDSYRMDIYQTRRTAAAPDWVYENTYKNALEGHIVDSPTGPRPRGVAGGVPFPIPASGAEVIWNHLLAWHGPAWSFGFTGYLVTAEGRHVLTVESATADQQMPYYKQGLTAAEFDRGDGIYTQTLLTNAGPPIRAGEGIVGHVSVDATRDSTWVYLTGQRRTRKLPNACCDTPTPASAGVMSFDEFFVFYGRIDRFDWKLLGKKEIYIPYNTNQLHAPASEEAVLAAHSLNPDHVRWELHRVWVLEADLKSTQRHVAPRSTYYVDEDSWNALLGERYDANGQLWKMTWQMPLAAPDIPGQVTQTFGFYDLMSGAWYVSGLYNRRASQYPVMPMWPQSHFTPEAMAAEGVR